jgi:hypothetical protein
MEGEAGRRHFKPFTSQARHSMAQYPPLLPKNSTVFTCLGYPPGVALLIHFPQCLLRLRIAVLGKLHT